MNVLIIGSNGFIGKTSLEYFNKKSYTVCGADISADTKNNFFKLNPDNPDFNKIFEQNKFDLCINASGAAVVSFSLTEPYTDFRLNTLNVFLILEAIRKYNPRCKFVNFSSAAVYGNPQYLPIDENHPLKPISPYGWHKLQSEIICREFADSFGVATCSLRVFSVFGPGIKKQLFWDLYQKTKTDESIRLFGTGNESRDFIYIDDLISALDMVVQKGNFKGESLNVSSGKETSIERAAEFFYKSYGLHKNFVFTGEEKKGDPVNWRADVSRISAMGFLPKVSFEEGIDKYVQWLKDEK